MMSMRVRYPGLWIVLVLSLAMALCGMSVAAVDSTSPQLPQGFYGAVSVHGVPAPAGSTVSATVVGVENHVVTDTAGYYGGMNVLESSKRLLVQGNGILIPEGSLITFYVDGVEAQVYDVVKGGGWKSSYPFTSGRVTKLNINVLVPTYTINATSGPNGQITPSGLIVVVEGANRTFDFIPDAGYLVDDVTVDDVSLGPLVNYTFMNVTADHTIEVSFVEQPVITYTINATAGPNGQIDPAGLIIVNEGADQQFVMTPDPGYIVEDVLVDDVSEGPLFNYTFTGVNEDHTIQVSFVEQPVITYTINATSGPNGQINPSGLIVVNEGADQQFMMTPDPGYIVEDVLVDDVSEGPLFNYTFTGVNEDHTIQVSFVEQPVISYTINATAGPNGQINPAGFIVVNPGDDQQFVMTPDSGYRVENVQVDGISQGPVTDYTFNDVDADHTIEVTFIEQEVITYTINATAGPDGQIDPAGLVVVLQGDDQLFTMTADTGYLIGDVIVDDVSQGPLASYTFPAVNADHTIEVTFVEEPVITYTINATAGPNGQINPAGLIVVNQGNDQQFIMTADTGYLIEDVIVDDVSQGPLASYTFPAVNADHTIEVTFVEQPVITFTINATAGPNGQINPAGLIVVNQGEDQRFDITPDSGFRIDDVIVDDVSIGAVTNYTFAVVTGDHQIRATFVEGGPEYIVVELAEGWNLFSTPVALDVGHDTLGTVFDHQSLTEIYVILGWDDQQKAWYQAYADEKLKPLEAYMVKVNSTATAYLYPSQLLTPPPSRDLPSGLCLIGSAPAFESGEFPATPLDQALISIKEAPGNLTGYTMVVSPPLNQPGWVYALGGQVHDLLPFKGYWVIMENPDTLWGFSTTPI